MSVAQYLERYAEPEALLQTAIEHEFEAVLVVPAHAEEATFLDGLRPAGRGAGGRLLLVVVVNSSPSSSSTGRERTRSLLRALSNSAAVQSVPGVGTTFSLIDLPEFALLVVDRTSPEHELPEKQGVGLARKIGTDLALGLWHAGKVRTPYVLSSDADVQLPADYVAAARSPAVRASALLYPFRHAPAGNSAIDAATLAYEISLRYHVLGLCSVSSPYAYHSVGSTLALEFDAYAKVRGFPKRLAGEDFYVLDKLAKIGSIFALSSTPIAIRSRISHRVPFGTGPRVQRIVSEGALGVPFGVYHPDSYRALGAVIAGLDAVSRSRGTDSFVQALAALPHDLELASQAASESLGLPRELDRATREVPRESALRRRLHTFFDGLKTVRFMHAVRDAARPDLELETALKHARFVPPGLNLANLEATREALARAEAEGRGAAGLV